MRQQPQQPPVTMSAQHDAISKTCIKRRYSEYKASLRKKDDPPTPREEPKDPAEEFLQAMTGDLSKPCWRCRLLRIPCELDPEFRFSCKNCSFAEEEDTMLWDFDCIRGELCDNVAKEIPDLPGLGSDKWFLPATEDIWLRIRMTYKNPENQIRDLDEFTKGDDTVSKRIDATIAFVEQFQLRRSYLKNYYEPMTEDIFRACAHIQIHILENAREIWSPLDEKNTLIATALRAFAFIRHIDMFEAYRVPTTKEEFVEGMFLEPEVITEEDGEMFGVFIEVSRVEDISEMSGMNRSNLRSLISKLFRVAQNTILKVRTKDFPIILCVLCILKLILDSMRSASPLLYGSSIGEVDAAWSTLCELYHLVARHCHPIVARWDKTLYQALVGPEGTSSVSYFELLHKIWVDNGFDEECGNQEFPERLESYITGYPLEL